MDNDEAAAETEQLLTELFPEARKPAGEKQFRIGVGLCLMAPFCVVVAYFPWPAAAMVDKLMWMGFALVSLVVGAWQIHRSNAKLSDDGSPPCERGTHPAPNPSGRTRRLKAVK